MSQQDNNTSKVKQYFEQLIELNTQEQQSKLAEIKQHKLLDDAQLALLKSMLHADDATDFATNVQAISAELVEQSSQVAQTNFLNQQIGVYIIQATIGHGGMGDVYLASRNDGEFEQKVAIKLPHAQFNHDLQARFENERQILAQLNHDNIARLLDGGTTDSKQPYLVMEYIDGLDIDKYCIKQLPTLNQRLDLIMQICHAVTFAHQKLVLHRDLKPGNILVTQAGQVKLLDFGIAKLLDSDNDSKTATQIMTRSYASPEQIQGKAVGTQSDLFSLAIIAYELITGFHPFAGDTQHQREQKLLSGTLTKITTRQHNQALFPELANIPTGKIQGDLENILHKALANEPEKRYVSVKDFADDLNNFCNNRPVKARKASFFYTFGKMMQRHKVATLAIVLTLFTLVASSIFSYQKAQEAERQKTIAFDQKQVAQKENLKSKQVTEFLLNIFKQARPKLSGEELTAEDILDDALIKLKNKANIDEETRFSMLNVIFDSYLSLNKYTKIQNNIVPYLRKCISKLSKTNEQCLLLMVTRAALEYNLEEHKKAIEILSNAEKIVLSQTPLNKNLYEKILFDYYNPLIELEQYPRAIKRIQMDLKIFQTIPDKNFDELIYRLHNLADTYIRMKNFDKAFEVIQQIDLKLKNNTQTTDIMLASNYNLTSIYYGFKHMPEKATKYGQLGIEKLEKHIKMRPKFLGDYLTHYAYNLSRSGRLQDAINAYKRAIYIYEKHTEGLDFLTLKFKKRVVLVYIQLNKIIQAQNIFDEIRQQVNDVSIFKSKYEQCYYQLIKTELSVISKSASNAQDDANDFKSCIKIHHRYEDYTHIIQAQLFLKKHQFKSAKTVLTNHQFLFNKFPNDFLNIKRHVGFLLNQIDSATVP